jgi:hypothetical protein
VVSKEIDQNNQLPVNLDLSKFDRTKEIGKIRKPSILTA